MKIIVQNLVTEYQDEGTGEVMLFLHGWQDNLHTFDLIAPLLLPIGRIVRLDLPGFGKSETPKEDWGMDEYVRFVSDFIQKLNLHVNTIVGHSFGGRIIIKGVATKNLQARKIILIASAGIANNRNARTVILKVITKICGLIIPISPLRFWREKLRRKMYRSIGSDYLDTGALRGTFLKIISEDLSACAKKISMPTLLIWGENDSETPLSDAKRLSQMIRGSALKILHGAGHFVQRDSYGEVAKLIRDFYV